jgi:phage replication O-like protein O
MAGDLMGNIKEQFVSYPITIQEALHTTNLSANESKILHFIIRKTFGWQKRTDQISQRQIEAHTGIDRRTVRKVLQRLKTRRIIVNEPYVKGGRHRAATLGVNPNVNKWLRVGAPQPPQGVGAKKTTSGRHRAAKSGRHSTAYKRKHILNNRKGGSESPALGEGQDSLPSESELDKKWREDNKRRVAELIKKLDLG